MSLLKQTLEGIAWTSVGKALAQVFGLVISIVLARLLTPTDFGLVGMLLVLTGFLQIFGEMGFGAALIQRKELDERHLSSAFWLNVLAGVVLAAVFVFGAPLIGRFYHEPRVIPLVRVIALDFVLAPLGIVQSAILSREMNFRALALAEVCSVSVSGVLALVLAITGFGVWALIVKVLAATVTTVIVVWTQSQWRPRWLLDRAAIKDLSGFSYNLVGFTTINYWARKSDDLLIGRVLGSAPLGLYTRAYSTMMMPLTEITGVLSRVMFPTLSKLQDDKQQFKRTYLKSISMIGLVSLPIMLLLAVVARSFVVAVFGRQWLGAVTTLEILCVVGAFQSIGTTVGWIYQARGRTDWMFRWGSVASLLIISSIGFGIYLGSIEAVAASYGVMTVCLLSYPQFYIPGRLIDMRPGEVLRALAGPLLCAIAMAAGLRALDLAWGGASVPWLRFPVETLVGLLVYLLLLHVFRVQAYAEVRAFIRARSQHKKGENVE